MSDGMPIPKIEYLSQPDRVSMGDSWFEIASPRHFWFIRRFQVLHRMAGTLLSTAGIRVAEFGCGNGVVQRQLEDRYGLSVDGFDLNELSLKQNISRRSQVFCYDIHQRKETLRGRYDLIFLFDVLEHIDDEDAFLTSLLFHLKPGGRLLINVPALQSLYSRYDEAVGHVRRYDLASMQSVTSRNGLETESATYWGLPLLPLLWIRKPWVRNKKREDIISEGMDPKIGVLNGALSLFSRLERIPQRAIGTSLMVVLRKPTTPDDSGSTTSKR